jgi:hypothetical protein
LCQVVGRSDVQQVVCGALRGYDAGPRSIGKCLGPSCDVCVVPLRVDLELVSEVRIQRS